MVKFTQVISVFLIFYSFRVESISIQFFMNRWPYVLSVQRNGEHICDGTFIRDSAILTSAKCVRDVNVSDLSIMEGQPEWNKRPNFQIAKSVYDVKDLHEGLAVLFLEKPTDLNHYNIAINSYKDFNGGILFRWLPQQMKMAPARYYGERVNEFAGTFSLNTLVVDECNVDMGSPLIKSGRPITIMGVAIDQGQCQDGRLEVTLIDVSLYKEKIDSIINSNGKEDKTIETNEVSEPTQEEEEGRIHGGQEIGGDGEVNGGDGEEIGGDGEVNGGDGEEVGGDGEEIGGDGEEIGGAGEEIGGDGEVNGGDGEKIGVDGEKIGDDGAWNGDDYEEEEDEDEDDELLWKEEDEITW